MNKRVFCILLLVALLSGYLAALPVSADALTVTIDGKQVPYQYETTGDAYLEDGDPMLPLVQTMDFWGLMPDRDGDTWFIRYGSQEVRMTPGTYELIVTGSRVYTRQPVHAAGNVIYVPGKELVTALGGTYTLQGGVFAINSQMDGTYLYDVKYGPGSQRDLWDIWQNSAIPAYEAGNYSEALPLLEQCVANFMPEAYSQNWAMSALYRVAVCYARLGNYPRAAAAFQQTAYYARLVGEVQTAQSCFEMDVMCRDEVSLYLKTDDLDLSYAYTHGVPYEPVRGVVTGYTNDRQDTYLDTVNKKPGIWLAYMTYGGQVPPPGVHLGLHPFCAGLSAVCPRRPPDLGAAALPRVLH